MNKRLNIELYVQSPIKHYRSSLVKILLYYLLVFKFPNKKSVINSIVSTVEYFIFLSESFEKSDILKFHYNVCVCVCVFLFLRPDHGIRRTD